MENEHDLEKLLHCLGVPVPFVASTMCWTCGKNVATMWQCDQCNKAIYCSEACQKDHWVEGGHHLQCNFKQKFNTFLAGKSATDFGAGTSKVNMKFAEALLGPRPLPRAMGIFATPSPPLQKDKLVGSTTDGIVTREDIEDNPNINTPVQIMNSNFKNFTFNNDALPDMSVYTSHKFADYDGATALKFIPNFPEEFASRFRAIDSAYDVTGMYVTRSPCSNYAKFLQLLQTCIKESNGTRVQMGFFSVPYENNPAKLDTLLRGGFRPDHAAKGIPVWGAPAAALKDAEPIPYNYPEHDRTRFYALVLVAFIDNSGKNLVRFESSVHSNDVAIVTDCDAVVPCGAIHFQRDINQIYAHLGNDNHWNLSPHFPHACLPIPTDVEGVMHIKINQQRDLDMANFNKFCIKARDRKINDAIYDDQRYLNMLKLSGTTSAAEIHRREMALMQTNANTRLLYNDEYEMRIHFGYYWIRLKYALLAKICSISELHSLMSTHRRVINPETGKPYQLAGIIYDIIKLGYYFSKYYMLFDVGKPNFESGIDPAKFYNIVRAAPVRPGDDAPRNDVPQSRNQPGARSKLNQ